MGITKAVSIMLGNSTMLKPNIILVLKLKIKNAQTHFPYSLWGTFDWFSIGVQGSWGCNVHGGARFMVFFLWVKETLVFRKILCNFIIPLFEGLAYINKWNIIILIALWIIDK